MSATLGETQDYLVFGGRLRSELEFPDLSVAPRPGIADWELRIGRSEAPRRRTRLQGTHEVEPGWVYRLHRLSDGLRLEFGAMGQYDVLSAGREIVAYPGPDVPPEMVRALVLGPVMALALHESGILCLHGSAVAMDGAAIAILAPKFFGKSTLAIALTAAGGRLMTDDLVAVRPSSPPTLLPGVHSVRMMGDVAARLGPGFPGATLHDGWKKTLTNLSRHRLAWEPAPLAAVYVLAPAHRLADGAARRTRLLLPEAAVSLAHHTKLPDGLVGYETAGAMLPWIATVVSSVPVYRLEVLRDLDRLPDVVREVEGWHAAPSASRPRSVAARIG